VTAGLGDAPGEALAEIVIGDRLLRLSRLDKVLWPEAGFTKRDLVAYLVAVAPALLPHLARRPATLARFPDGVAAPGFFQSRCPPGRPEWLPVADVEGRRGQKLPYPLLEEPAALAWVANLAAIELHPFTWTVDRPQAPRALVLDLDPGSGAGLTACCRIALRLREALDAVRIAAWPKTSGAKGLHLLAPLDATQPFREVKAFARSLARELAERFPAEVTDRMPIGARSGKVLLDWRQNAAGLSTVAPYSVRAAPVPLVSTPLRWEEVEEAAATGDVRRLWFQPADVLARLARWGELFRPVLGGGQRVPVAT
jgi:bifunctional non-homologous end joining protein LigD